MDDIGSIPQNFKCSVWTIGSQWFAEACYNLHVSQVTCLHLKWQDSDTVKSLQNSLSLMRDRFVRISSACHVCPKFPCIGFCLILWNFSPGLFNIQLVLTLPSFSSFDENRDLFEDKMFEIHSERFEDFSFVSMTSFSFLLVPVVDNPTLTPVGSYQTQRHKTNVFTGKSRIVI